MSTLTVILKALIHLLGMLARLSGTNDLASVRSIVVVELTRMGDVLAMLPALDLLARRFPGAVLHVVVDSKYASLLRMLDARWVPHGITRPETTGGFLRTVRSVRALRADLAISMSPPKRNAAVALASGAPRKVGYLTYVDSLAPYLTSTPVTAIGCRLAHEEVYAREPIEERSLKICRALGCTVTRSSFSLNYHEEIGMQAKQHLRQKGLLLMKPYVILHPFSGWHFRSWPLERFVEVAHAILAQAPGYEVIFLCEDREAHLLESVRPMFDGHDGVRFVASDDLVTTACLMHGAAVVVGNDSGPLHLAAALGVPVVGLFGPAPPSLTAPRNVQGTLLYHPVECSPCDQWVCIRPHASCMTMIPVTDVVQSVLRQLSHQPVAQPIANVEG
jgi:ADP-heptose:LPS heptosyltransferase